MILEPESPPAAQSEAIVSVPARRSEWIARWLVPALIVACFLILYLYTQTRWYTFDSVAYATRIRQFSINPKPEYLIHPHHLLFNGLGYLCWSLLDFVGIRLSSLEALQAMNAAVGAILLAVFYRMLLTRGFRFRGLPVATNRWPVVELAATICLGVSFGFWAVATDGRVNAPALLCLTIAIGYAWGMIDNLRTGQVLACAGATVLAVAFHQSHGLIIVFCATCILVAIAGFRRKLAMLALYLGSSLAGIAALYAIAGFGILGKANLAELKNWALTYSEDGRWWKLDFMANLIDKDDKAYTQSFVAAPPLPSEGGMSGWQSQLLYDLRFLVLPLALALGAATLVYVGFSLFRRRDDEVWRKAVAMFALFVPYTAFFTIWDPGYWVFWIPAALGTVALAAILPSKSHWAVRGLAALGLVAWAGATLTANASASFLRRRDPDHNEDLIATLRLGHAAKRNELMLVTGMGEAAKFEVYAPYFAELQVSVVHMEMKRAGASFEKAKHSIRAKIEDAMRNGKRVYVAREYYSDAQWNEIRKRYTVPVDAREQILAGYDRVDLKLDSKVPIFYLRAIPPPKPKVVRKVFWISMGTDAQARSSN